MQSLFNYMFFLLLRVNNGVNPHSSRQASPNYFVSNFVNLNCVCCTLRSWVHPISMLFRTFSPRLEDIDTFQCSSDNFNIDDISQGVCKTVRTSFYCIIVLQSRGEGPEKAHNYGTDSGQISGPSPRNLRTMIH